jgi:OOP family OmpA-OmpF porin
VVGHTDNQGTAEHNLDLSRRRAASVVRELNSNAQVASNAAEEGRAKNRRVELVSW